ncbi:MAG TPA: trypsin-like peptidase domain-containing protein [Acidimicrobiales bacterium]|nr:trypsin-like peptidase domain-containing protein [Acidimicrobiales bacterium]
MGGIVGAVVAALVAAGLVLATDDGTTVGAGGPGTTALVPRPPGAELDVQQLVDVARPSVVEINVSSGGQAGAGSGFVYDAEEGLILTNAHVIEGAAEISVVFFDGSTVEAELVGSFPADDVAMVRVEGKGDLRAAALGSSAQLEVGEDVVAIGNALGLGGEPTVTQGIISAKDRTIESDAGPMQHLLQTDAAINPGNSGGPLLNARGEVVGMNTAIIQGASNVGFALAIDAIRPLIEELRSGDGEVNPDQAFLGVSGVAVNDPSVPPEVLDEFAITTPFGVLVSNVVPGSAAEEAGLRVGDVITSIGGQTAENADVLTEVVRSRAPGDQVEITYEREGQEDTVSATLARRGG